MGKFGGVYPRSAMNELLFRLIRFTLFAGEFATEVRGAAFGSEDPGTEGPGWIMADVLGVATFEVSDPVRLVVLMKGDDFAEDGHERRFHHKGHVNIRSRSFQSAVRRAQPARKKKAGSLRLPAAGRVG